MPANKEIWVIGDGYMTFASQHIEYWKEKARQDPHEALYILHWFDVKVFPPQLTTTNSVEVILNTLTGALNNRPKPPDILVVMLGDTKFWCDANALTYTMDSIIKIMLKEIRRILQVRQKDLPVKAQKEEPRLFFVKLNWKPEKSIDSVPGYPKKRRTFNKLLDTVVRPRGANTILLHEINDKLDPNLFLAHGDLSPKGYRQVWSSLSKAIQDFLSLGHRKKKVYTSKPNFMSEVDSPLYSSDDDLITNFALGDHDQCKWSQTSRMQTKRKGYKNTRGGFKNKQNWNIFN